MYESDWLTYQRLFLARNSNQCLQIQTGSIIPYSHWLAIGLILLLGGVIFDWEYGSQDYYATSLEIHAMISSWYTDGEMNSMVRAEDSNKTVDKNQPIKTCYSINGQTHFRNKIL